MLTTERLLNVFVLGMVECDEILSIIGIFSTLEKAQVVQKQYLLKNKEYYKEIEAYPKIVKCELDQIDKLYYDDFINHSAV